MILLFFLYSFEKNKFVKSRKLLPFNIKSINFLQKYPHIIESYVSILQIFVMIFLFPMNFLISFGICSSPKLSKNITLLPFTYKAIQFVPTDLNSSRLIT